MEDDSVKRRFKCPVETKKELVAEVMLGYRIEFVARKYGMAPKTLRNWVRQYQEEVDAIMVKKKEHIEQMKQDSVEFKDMQKKYKDAMKLLGEKELENNILKDLLKKTNPAAFKDLK